MELWHYGALIAAGIVGGAINVMAGGGSVITVPVMVFLGVPGPIANGTNRIAILAQNLTAVGTFMRGGQGNFRLQKPSMGSSSHGARRLLGRFYSNRRRVHLDADFKSRYGPRSGEHQCPQVFYCCGVHFRRLGDI